MGKRGEVTGDWTQLHNDEVYDFDSTSVIMRVMKQKEE